MLNISAQGSIPSRLYRADQVRELDRVLIEERGIPGLTLMRRAASACCDVLLEKWPVPARVRVYCGSGNNAADGYIVAGMLAEKAIPVDVVVIGDPAKLGKDGVAAYAYCRQSEAVMVAPGDSLASPTVIVDALLGTGVQGAPRDHYRRAIEEINALGVPILAVDVPSGLNVDTGAVADIAVVADITVTFIGLKQGCFTAQGVDHVGRIHFADLGPYPDPSSDLLAPGPVVERLDLKALLSELPRRVRNAHKFKFGHVLVVGGDLGMGGAPLMSALAAIRSGAGLVSLATRPELAPILMAQQPELMIRGVLGADDLEPLLAQATVVVLGPGLGQNDWGQALFNRVLASDLPLVIDADGLNLLAQNPVKRGNWILTPHPGEASRLLSDDDVQSHRFDAVQQLQAKYGGIAVLKGAGTLVSSEQAETGLCPYGNPGMSTAGMGDVLAGVVGGVSAQLPNLSVAARLAVALHSAAGDRCAERAGEVGLMATDLIPVVRELINDR
jgi:hydroxyethylthiazole kinase-like uncharacterized protein yjeF